MNRLVLAGAVLATLALARPVAAQSNEYGWTVSNSPTDPLVNTGPAGSGEVVSYYLWFYCSGDDGMAAAEFDVEATGIALLDFTTTNGFLNAGGITNLLLAVGGCPTGPLVAGSWIALDLPGSICIVPSAANGWSVTVDCSADPLAWNNNMRGFSNVGEPCGVSIWDLCIVYTSVADESWGGIKGMYR